MDGPAWGKGWRFGVLMGGVLLLIVGGGAVWLNAVQRSGGSSTAVGEGVMGLAGILVGVLGTIVIIGGIVYGLQVDRKPASIGTRSTVPYAKIVSRHVYENGRLVIAEWEIEALERPRYYVKVLWPDGSIDELETAESVWRNCGEGMFGEAERKGRWLGRFVPYIG